MPLPDRIRLPLHFDPVRLANDLPFVEARGWTPHFVTQNYEGQWDAIALRAPAGETHPIRMIYSDPMARAFVDTPALAAAPYFRSVLNEFRCPLQAVRLMRLTPGSQIKPHSDPDLDADSGLARLHIPVVTSPDVTFLLNKKPVMMASGECWYLRLSDVHSIRNDGPADRIHIVLDVVADSWLMGLLTASIGTEPLGSMN
jgi:Aspartyl/Asparaginyl beta-hydroxylase.